MAIAVLLLQPASAWAEVNPAELTKVVQEIEQLDMLRSGLASTLEGQTTEPTQETTKEVCRPVGTLPLPKFRHHCGNTQI